MHLHTQTLVHDFSLIVVNHHLASHPLPFYPFPFVLFLISWGREIGGRRKKKKVGGYLYWVAPPLSPGHWEWVNTKPPLLTSTLKHPDAGRQGGSLAAAACQHQRRVNGQRESEFKTSVIVQSVSQTRNTPAASSSSSARRYLRSSVWDTGTVLMWTRKCVCLCEVSLKNFLLLLVVV